MEQMRLRQRFLSSGTASVCGARDAVGNAGEPSMGTALPGVGGCSLQQVCWKTSADASS